MSIIPFKGNSITLGFNEISHNIYDSKNHHVKNQLNKNYSYNIYSLKLPTQ